MGNRLDIDTLTLRELAKTIDHSLLRPELTDQEVLEGCDLARRYDVASVCVKPCHVKMAAEALAGCDVAVGTVIGFPHGSVTTKTKIFEARQAIEDGAVELDMVLNIGALRSGRYEDVLTDIAAVVEAARGKALVKVILENAYLTSEQIQIACHACEKAGADFVKTSTGFAPSGAKLDDLRLMCASVGPDVQVKAAGGVRTLDAALQVIDVGVTRIGATATATILDDYARRLAGEFHSSPSATGLGDGY
jgi:deoxyribose-phosphate aldolase